MKNKRAYREKRAGVTDISVWALLLCAFIPFLALLPGCQSRGPDTAGYRSGYRAVSRRYEPGVYEGTGSGYKGAVHVSVQVSPVGIEDIVITRHNETAYPGAAAMEELLDAVLETGSTDLDAVSGATFSSRGFLEAVDDALRQAHGKTAGL